MTSNRSPIAPGTRVVMCDGRAGTMEGYDCLGRLIVRLDRVNYGFARTILVEPYHVFAAADVAALIRGILARHSETKDRDNG